MKIKIYNGTLEFVVNGVNPDSVLYDYSGSSNLTKDYIINTSGIKTSNIDQMAVMDFKTCDGGSKVYLSVFGSPTTPSQLAIAFYSSNTEESFISGVSRIVLDPRGAENRFIDIPETAKYIRCTYYSDYGQQEYGLDIPFVCKVLVS